MEPRQTPRSRPTPRVEGMQKMVDAAVALLREHSADAVTVRDIADRSGHHHRFVAAWFGGKVGLFGAAFEQMAADAATTVRFPFGSGVIDDELIRIVQLMNWLVANDPGALGLPRATPIFELLIGVYVGFGLSPVDARLFAQRLLATVTSFVLFAAPFGISDDDIRDHLALERRLIAAAAGG